MDDVKICPQCERCTDSDQDTCPFCGSAFTKSPPENTIQPGPVQEKNGDPGQQQDTGNGSILLATNPRRASFFFKYLMALFPIMLVIVCIFARIILQRMFQIGSSSFISSVPVYMSGYTTSTLNQYASPITFATNLTILMIAPVGIFLFFASVGWTMRLSELWISTSLTLGMSAVAGIIMTSLAGVPLAPGNFLFLLLEWIEFMVQPFCFVAALIVILATEKFRQSITYTITEEGLRIRGGFLSIQEHMIPHTQIGRIVFEQDFLGSMFNYGTLIPQSTTRWGQEMSFRGVGAAGQKDSFGVGLGIAKGREEGSRYPLDCLYGVSDPKAVQKILTDLICKYDKREDEQVFYLKKIYETNLAKIAAREPVLPYQGPGLPFQEHGTDTKPGILDDTNIQPRGDFAVDRNIPEYPESTIIRIPDNEILPTIISSASSTIREIPPVVKAESSPLQEISRGDPVLDTIKKLAELKNSGIITEEEFITKKTELLKRL
jgi:hypothetical protein